MTSPLPPLLVIDDEKNMRASLCSILSGEGYTVRPVESAEEALRLLEREEFFMAISDFRLGGMTGGEFIKRAHGRWPRLPIVLFTAYATPKLAADAIKSGAFDYLPKPFEPEELLNLVARCAERFRLLRENAALRARSSETCQIDDMIGESPSMRALRDLVRTVAPSNATVLILGESGTGKELIAGALHSLSSRHGAPYVRINCAAIPEALLESELFGHEKGAFTGAVKQKPGRVEEAHGGTIFLDEIGDMSRPLQAKLLRFLEDGTFTRVGGNAELRVDVRLIAATNRDIVTAIRENEFREDLFHRLNVVQFRPPALRERGEDVPLLAEHFLRHFNTVMKKHVNALSPAARQKLQAHHWPGNVRELRNVIERAVILETTTEVQARNLPDFAIESGLRKPEAAARPPVTSLDEAMGAYEREVILQTLEQHRFNLTRTADQLRISRHALRYRMQRLNIAGPADVEEETTAPAA